MNTNKEDTKGAKDSRENRGTNTTKDSRGNKGTSTAKDSRGNRGTSTTKDSRRNGGTSTTKDSRSDASATKDSVDREEKNDKSNKNDRNDKSDNKDTQDNKGKKNIVKEFKDFLIRGDVISLAIGVIIGGAFTGVINSFVGDIIMPLISMLIGEIHFSNLQWILSPATNTRSEIAVMYGSFIGTVINFCVISLCIFVFVLLIGKNPEKIKTKDEAQKAQGEKTNQLLEEIRDALKNKQS